MNELEAIREFLRRGVFQLTENDARALVSCLEWLDRTIEATRESAKEPPGDSG